MNTEIMVVWGTPDFCYNQLLKFQGTLEEAKEYAQNHNFGGGVELKQDESTPFEQLKVGDLVLVHTRNVDYLSKVEKVTPKQVIIKHGFRFKKSNGNEVGGEIYSSKHISIPTQKQIKDCIALQQRKKAVISLKEILENIEPKNLSDDMLSDMANLCAKLNNIRNR